MKNVTLTLDEAIIQWARRLAAEQSKSLSCLISEILQERMQESAQYELAMREYFDVQPRPLGKPDQRYAARDELHDRTRLR